MGRGSTFRFYKSNPYAIENIDLFCKMYRPEYELLTREYNGVKSKYLWRYNGEFYMNKNIVLSREFECTIDGFVNGGVKHSNLTLSKLALEVIRVLEKYNIKYEREKKFIGCRDKGQLFFDFYIDRDLNNLDFHCSKICLEADGLQHEIPIAIWDYNGKSLEDRQRKDNIKNIYCVNNGIYLIRIKQREIRRVEEIICNLFNLSINQEIYILGTNKTEIEKKKNRKQPEVPKIA
jgi:very-short-patch-repair endonuclease